MCTHMEISDIHLLEYTHASWTRGVYKVMITMFVLQVHTYIHTYVGECEVVLPLSAHSNMCAQGYIYLHNFTPFYMACWYIRMYVCIYVYYICCGHFQLFHAQIVLETRLHSALRRYKMTGPILLLEGLRTHRYYQTCRQR